MHEVTQRETQGIQIGCVHKVCTLLLFVRHFVWTAIDQCAIISDCAHNDIFE